MVFDLSSPTRRWRVRPGVLGLAGLGVIVAVWTMYLHDQGALLFPWQEDRLARDSTRPPMLSRSRGQPDAGWEGNPAGDIGLDPMTWQMEPEPEILLEEGTTSISGSDSERSRHIEGMEGLGIELFHDQGSGALGRPHGSKFRRAWRLSGIRDQGSTSTTR